MAHYPKIWFLRHGQTEWNRVYRLQGQLDSPLTDQGVAEAQRQALIMPGILAAKPDLFVSPLGRAVQTAEIVLAGAPYRTDARLMEIHAGDWQGRTRGEIVASQPRWAHAWPTGLEIYQSAVGGEGIAAFEARIIEFLQSLVRPTVIVAHGLLGQVLRAHVLGIGMPEAGRLSNLQGVVYVLENGTETVLEGSA